jgi:SsrA-binding protein
MAKKNKKKADGGAQEGKPAPRVIARNKKAFHEYEILETLECGIALQGSEVKSLREGNVSFAQSFVLARGDELTLLGLHIAPYREANILNHEPERKRRLLAHKREIRKLQQRVEERGLTLVPLKLYWKNGRAKVEIGLARGKQAHDKRDTLREKDLKRRIERESGQRHR